MNKFNKLGLGTILAIGGSQAFAATDYTSLTSSVSFAEVTPILLSVAGLVVAYVLIKNNIGAIMQFVKGKAK